MENSLPQPEIGLDELNSLLEGLDLRPIESLSPSDVAVTLGMMLQRMSLQRKQRNNQHDVVNRIRLQCEREREKTQRERQSVEGYKQEAAELAKKLSAVERESQEKKAKLIKDRDRCKKEAVLHAQRINKLESEAKRKSREVGLAKQRIKSLMEKKRSIPPASVEISSTLSPAEHQRPATKHDGSDIAGMHGMRMSAVVKENESAREALQNLRAEMQASLIRSGIKERPSTDEIRTLIKLPYELCCNSVRNELDHVLALFDGQSCVEDEGCNELFDLAPAMWGSPSVGTD